MIRNAKLVSTLCLSLLTCACQYQDIARYVHQGDLSSIRRYLSSGGDPNALVDGQPLLYIAMTGRDKIGVAEILLAAGADVNFGGKTMSFPLLEAANWGHTDAIEWFVSKGADLNSIDGDGYTAIMYFIFSTHSLTKFQPTFNRLVTAGASLCHVANDGNSVSKMLWASGDKELAIRVDDTCASESTAPRTPILQSEAP